jgi:hypothetical protein
VAYKSDQGCIEVFGTERAVRNVYQMLYDMPFLKVSPLFDVQDRLPNFFLCTLKCLCLTLIYICYYSRVPKMVFSISDVPSRYCLRC